MNFQYLLTYQIANWCEISNIIFLIFPSTGAAIWILDWWLDPWLSRIISTNVDLKTGVRRKRKEPGGPKMSLKQHVQFTFQIKLNPLSIYLRLL